MPTLTDLRNAVDALLVLPAIPSVLQLNSNTRERAFEAYVFSLVVQAVRQADGTAELHGIPTRRSVSALAPAAGSHEALWEAPDLRDPCEINHLRPRPHPPASSQAPVRRSMLHATTHDLIRRLLNSAEGTMWATIRSSRWASKK